MLPSPLRKRSIDFPRVGGIHPAGYPEQSPFPRITQTLQRRGRGRSRGTRRERDLAPLNRGAHQPSLPVRATPSTRHPLPPPLPVTLRKEECNCSCPSKREGAQLPSFLTPPTESQTLLVSLPHPTPTSLAPRRGQSGPNFPAPSKSPFPKAEVPLPFRREVRGGVGRRSPLQRSGSRSAGGRGVRRRRGPGDGPPPPPPRSPSEPPSPSSATRGGGWGGRGDDWGRRGALSAWAQLRWRGEVPRAGSRRRHRRLGGTGPGLGRLPSSHSRGPLGPPPRPLGGRAHAQPFATTTTPGKGALTKRREAAGRPAGGGAGSPGAGRPQRFAAASHSRPAKGAGKRDPSSFLRQAAAPTHSLCHPPSLSPQALKPQNPAAAQVPPPSPTPLPSSRQSSQSSISRDFSPDRPGPARDTTAYACAPSRERASACTGRSRPFGPESQPLSSPASVSWRSSYATRTSGAFMSP